MAIKVLALGVAVYSNIGIQSDWFTAPVTNISFFSFDPRQLSMAEVAELVLLFNAL